MIVLGVDGLSTFVATEPYSRSNANSNAGGGGNSSGGHGQHARGGRGGRGRQPGAPGGGRMTLSGKSMEEKLALLCRDFNSARGCARSSCSFLHKCSWAEKDKNMVCFANHNKMQH